MAVLWHRRDLRAVDNRGLAEAASSGPVLPVFVLDPAVLEHASPPRVAFLLDALEALRADYRSLGGDLLVRRGDPAEVLPDIADDRGAERVVWHDDYSGLARDRDRRVRDALESAGVGVSVVDDLLLHAPGSVLTNAGEPYKVYTPFREKWIDRPKDAPVDPPGTVAAAATSPLPSLDELGFDAPEATVPAAGHRAAKARLGEFRSGPIHRYAEDRDYPARAGTSRLSADLHFGTIGVREVWAATDDAMAAAPDGAARESVREFRDQLAWREFYHHVLAADPGTVTGNVRAFERPIEWRNDPEELAAWKAGETGFPVVDAGMRQLRSAAWMHNRVRMIVASFLTKDLLVDWRAGYRHFREHLVDHDTANDVGGWQWAASTGTDPQPFFRVFNPSTQGERYDPDGDYVREHVPELRGVDSATIHGWTELEDAERSAAAPEYPAPIVDHAARREAAIEAFRRARGE